MNSPKPMPGPSSPTQLSRRLFLGGSASALAAGVLTSAFLRPTSTPAGSTARANLTAEIAPAATAYDEALRALGRTTLRAPDSRPFPGLAAGTDTMPGIEHIVVLMMENHS